MSMFPDKATPDPRFPPLPVKLYPVGRFVFPVPEGLEFLGSTLSINKIAIDEIRWKPGKDRDQQFRDLWMPVRDEARKNYDRRASMGRATQGGLAEQDVSELFGHPAMLLCYDGSWAEHHVDVYIALPEYILRLDHNRFYRTGAECLDMEAPIIKLFKHYRVGHGDFGPDSFVTPKGRIEGIKPWAEEAWASSHRNATESKPNIDYEFNADLELAPGTPPNSISLARGEFKKIGSEMTMLRSRQRTLAGMDGLEEVYVLSGMKDERKRAGIYATWDYPGERGNPEKPFCYMKLDCEDAAAKEDVLRMWDAIMNNFNTIRAWHEKNKGGR
jgi:hypothetical protein